MTLTRKAASRGGKSGETGVRGAKVGRDSREDSSGAVTAAQLMTLIVTHARGPTSHFHRTKRAHGRDTWTQQPGDSVWSKQENPPFQTPPTRAVGQVPARTAAQADARGSSTPQCQCHPGAVPGDGASSRDRGPGLTATCSGLTSLLLVALPPLMTDTLRTGGYFWNPFL